MALPYFSYATANARTPQEPIFSNLFEINLFDMELTHNQLSDKVFDVTFNFDNNGETITLLYYNDEKLLLSVDKVKEFKFISITVHDKVGMIIEKYILHVDFKSAETNYTFEIMNNNKNTGINTWKVAYTILHRGDTEQDMDVFIKQYKREMNISKLEDE